MQTSSQTEPTEKAFTRYQVFIIAILAILQFTVILDFMVLSPLGAMLMEELHIIPSQFGLVVSAYAFSAGASGLLAAGFADRFDRKKLLVFFYTGFVLGTLLCGIANSYQFLLVARVVTGLFGGVIGSIGYAIIADLFAVQVRGRVMGFVQAAFAASQILGIPIGLLLANQFGWHATFLMIVGVSIVVGILIIGYMKPITAHLNSQSATNPFGHLAHTLSQPTYILAFATTTLLATGGFMLMPFGSAFAIYNLGVSMQELPVIYAVTGVFSIVFGPIIGKLSDKIGKYPMFVIGSLIAMVFIAIYNNLGVTPLWLIILLNVITFIGVSSRMISGTALMTAIPKLPDRGAFMSVNSSVQQISGGIGSAVAGLIVIQESTKPILHYDILGYVVIVAMVITVVMMYFVNRRVNQLSGQEALPKDQQVQAEV
ncbi:MFS transporter [Rhodocytophaga aerolata]|uniref:MFS transporter n=1 Tax=Rhodocytophaga aerolata TaxID=455078 RepID=A0ABT8RAF3_9BACT|nr:MFS transporter [Rhodocytophaga aerolata]MDO1448183.1 MFS transporter [Rhodocytophaga aerolata]